MLKRKHLEKKVLFLWENPYIAVFICHISFNLVPSRYGKVSKIKVKLKRRILMKKQIRNNWMFCICAAITAAASGLGLMNAKPVMAEESVGEEMVVSDVAAVDAAGELSENSWGG